MPTETEASIARLLAETLAAHGAYETTALGGRYDEHWSEWYATCLLEHGLLGLVPQSDRLDQARLSAILTQLDADYRRDQPDTDWPVYYAERLGAMLD
jgi:hypothetical protein